MAIEMLEGYKNMAIVSACTFCMMLSITFFISASPANGQTPFPTTGSTPLIPFGAPGGAPAVMGGISGFVLDENGMPVSDANVTLWLNGKIADYPHDTSIFSEIYDPNSPGSEGSFQYYGVYPGNYTIIAEKDGYKGMILANVSKDTIHDTIDEINVSTDTTIANITLQGYHVPSLNPLADAYGGSITGTVFDQQNHTVPVADITLFQDEQVVKILKNPQHVDYNGTYIFQNLMPGEYQIIAEVQEGMLHRSSPMSVEVNNSTVMADLTLEDYAYEPPGIPLPSATIYPAQNTTVPTPFPDIPEILLAMAISCFFLMKKK